MKYYGLQSAADLHETVHILEDWRNELFTVRRGINHGRGGYEPSLQSPDRKPRRENDKQRITMSALKFITAYQPRIPTSFRRRTVGRMLNVMDKALFGGDISLDDLYIAGLKTELRLIKNARLIQIFHSLLFCLSVLLFSYIISKLPVTLP